MEFHPNFTQGEIEAEKWKIIHSLERCILGVMVCVCKYMVSEEFVQVKYIFL